LDKLLISASIQDIKAIICVNKIDLDEEGNYQRISAAYGKAHYTCLPISSVRDIGFQKLREELKDNITVFAGQSGVGKSTILNKIMKSMVMETGSISERIERGKHTTRHAELLNLEEGGFIADTPGFSTLELPDIQCEVLPLHYHEFDDIKGSCRFTGCSHISEPGCIVKEALERSLIDAERYERYVKFYNMLKLNKKYNKKV
jgi:ribosome biogenesis GTPase